MKKLAVLIVIAALVAAYFAFDVHKLVTIDALKDAVQPLLALRDQYPLYFIAAFFGIYLVSAAFSLPAVTLLTLAAGALFGWLEGTVIVSFASSIGATLAFWTSRYFLRDGIQARFGDRLGAINEGMARDGAFYLFSLRLIPVFPFFLINLLMGLTPIKTRTFYLVSQIGMLAGTLVYVNAGTQLAQIEGLSGILSPTLIASFALLAVFPWIVKFIMGMWQRHRLYSPFPKPRRFDRNLIVIGAGAAGLVSAYIAAAVKAKVTLIEGHKMGGDCLNYGCVPSKAMIKSAKLAQQMREADRFGLTAGEPSFSFRKVMDRIHRVIAQIAPHDSVERYTKLGVEVLEGKARIVSPWAVEITLNDGSIQTLTTRSIVIATGARPFVPPLPGIEESDYVTSDTLWDRFGQMDKAPERVVVLGGGPIGSELAQAMARLGSKVTQVEKGDRLLVREDEEVSGLARSALEASGVTVLTGHSAIRCDRVDAERFIVVQGEGETRRIAFDALIVAVGRVARLDGYGLEALKIPVGRTISTNAYLETIYPNIFAAGDVAGPFQFTHTASHQAWYASVNALFGVVKKFRADYRVIPWTTFLDPEIARVGLNEQEAREKKIPYEVTRYGIDDLDRAIADSADHGFVKILTPPGKDKILGVTIVGEHAGDLMAEFVLAMKWGLGLNKILATIHTYPTMAEANKYAAGEWKRAHVSPFTMWLLKSFHALRRG
ncbi:MAG: FAD-dependent oxidoreductase [Aquidulcibacter sp.]|jgi:pyruvate/2-oxoglutarate dehydrogenase complex dihydrolipoamide dehydrogenase (E3) component/uncharacterized membrane protein YdjX (TVP38/TMEM64 family)|uniref:FAD-dependent oxidoreductase n=1 Tax=Aquidulcibacter sp. TaxID=2052990 RepID=UPI0022CA36C0|nr:bifunctional TVP38/TMEM64 family protein/FAD-dependent oxidoreductase [Aquidulcibacter sp.]MCZ8209375.1 FAD-dependent oxidoreductase [Aquidulcibacter sp.]